MIGAILCINADYSSMDSCDRKLLIERDHSKVTKITVNDQTFFLYKKFDEITENYLCLKYPQLIRKLKDNECLLEID